MVVSHSCVSSSQLCKLVPVHKIEVLNYVAGFPCSCTVEESIDYVLWLLLFPLLKVLLVALLLPNSTLLLGGHMLYVGLSIF